MPEYREAWCHWKFLRWLRWNGYRHKSWEVRGLWADLTAAEATKHNHHTVYKMKPDSKLARGHAHNQTHLWPQYWAEGTPRASEPLSKLVLKGRDCIGWTARAIVLDFGPLILKLSYLMHTSLQVYSREIWETRILPEPTANRNAKIALAIEFKEHVLVFLSKDLLVQPEWVPRGGHNLFKEPDPPDVYCDFETKFLTRFTAWMKERRTGRFKRNGLAYSVFEDSDLRSIWHGVGAYSVHEIFVMAGDMQFLTEAEVFDNPSRTARLCAAFFTFAADARDDDVLWNDVVAPAIDSTHYLLAPSIKQRERYGRYLRVWAQKSMKMSKRMFTIVKDNIKIYEENQTLKHTWYRNNPAQSGLYDPFEPYLIRKALERFPFLHPLIFGASAANKAIFNDPLTEYFLHEGIGLDTETFLKPDIYDCNNLFSEPPTRWATQNTLTFQVGKTAKAKTLKTIWTILPPFPENCAASPDEPLPQKIQVVPVVDTWDEETKEWYLYRTAQLLKSVARTNDVTIGPLEYFGNAHVHHGTHNIVHIFAFRGDLGDPSTSSTYYAERVIRRRRWQSINDETKKRVGIEGASATANKTFLSDMERLNKRVRRREHQEQDPQLENADSGEHSGITPHHHEGLESLPSLYDDHTTSETSSFLAPQSDSEYLSAVPSSRASTPPPTDTDQDASLVQESHINRTPFLKKRKRRTSADSSIIAEGALHQPVDLGSSNLNDKEKEEEEEFRITRRTRRTRKDD